MPAEICAVHVAGWSSDGSATASRVQFAAAMGLVAGHAFHMSGNPTETTRQAFLSSSALCAVIPTWRLDRPRGFEYLGDVISLIERIDEDRQP